LKIVSSRQELQELQLQVVKDLKEVWTLFLFWIQNNFSLQAMVGLVVQLLEMVVQVLNLKSLSISFTLFGDNGGKGR